MAALPPFAPYPQASWRQHLSTQEWKTLSEAWISLSEAYISLPDDQLRSQSESAVDFVVSYVQETAASSSSPQLSKAVFQLTTRLLQITTSSTIISADFVTNFSKLYPKKLVAPILAQLFVRSPIPLESSLSVLKRTLIPHLESGMKGNLKMVEEKLTQLNPLLHVSPQACIFFLAGSDFFDALVTGFKIMNPPLRKVIIATVYLCLIGLTETEPPKWSMLSDELFALKEAADEHKAGPLNVNDSLVPELVTSTPILKIILRKAEDHGAATTTFKNRIHALQPFIKGAMIKPKRLTKRKIDKGKGKQSAHDIDAEMHIHLMSHITQVQDLFPDLGSGFVAKCLDEYSNDVEQVVANLLGDSLPPHLASLSRSEPLSTTEPPPKTNLAPHSTPPQLPTRHNVFDDDEFDRLAADTSKISFGKRPDKTADELLRDRSSAPGKAAILSALAAFDSDDDERDDTYDADDVGGTVDASTSQEDDASEEALFRAYLSDPALFSRDAATRRAAPRTKLREDTGMTDEAIEGWAVMLARTPQQMRRLEAKYAFDGKQQNTLERTAWREGEDSDRDGATRGRGRGRGRGGPGRGRGGNVAGAPSDQGTEAARRNKEANKSSRANHNRKGARAKKMARGGLMG